MKPKPLPSQAILRELFNYDPWSGILTYRVGPRKGTMAKRIRTLAGAIAVRHLAVTSMFGEFARVA
jgi:hypothetical protein